MEGMKTFHLLAFLVAILWFSPINGQITTPCTTSMISNFTPCLNFITGSTANGSSTPTRACCDSLKSLMHTSMDCACLVITANIPVPINRTLSISLPRACKMGGVPLQCKAAGTPLPAPGPAAILGPTLAPVDASPLSPRASKTVAPSSVDLTPISPSVESEAPSSSGIRPVLASPPPSASNRLCFSPSSILLPYIGIMIFS